MKTWSVYPEGGGRLFIEADDAGGYCGRGILRFCVVSGGNPPSAAWVAFSPDDIVELRTVLDNAIIAVGAK
jgi:hypothetical protein